jgi:hypothetical protein
MSATVSDEPASTERATQRMMQPKIKPNVIQSQRRRFGSSGGDM